MADNFLHIFLKKVHRILNVIFVTIVSLLSTSLVLSGRFRWTSTPISLGILIHIGLFIVILVIVIIVSSFTHSILLHFLESVVLFVRVVIWSHTFILHSVPRLLVVVSRVSRLLAVDVVLDLLTKGAIGIIGVRSFELFILLQP